MASKLETLTEGNCAIISSMECWHASCVYLYGCMHTPQYKHIQGVFGLGTGLIVYIWCVGLVRLEVLK